MTDRGREFALSRLNDAPTLQALAAVWSTLGIEYQRDQAVQDAKNRMKLEHMKREAK